MEDIESTRILLPYTKFMSSDYDDIMRNWLFRFVSDYSKNAEIMLLVVQTVKDRLKEFKDVALKCLPSQELHKLDLFDSGYF